MFFADRMPGSATKNRRFRPLTPLRLLLLALAVALVADSQAVGREAGQWIIVHTPITSESVTRIKNQTLRGIEKRNARKIVYQFQYGGPSDFGPCRDLAEFILRDVRGRAETYAYVAQPLKGHAVLPALACRFLWMGPSGAIGDVNPEPNPPLGKPEQMKYLEIAEARGRPPALVLKMLYPGLSVYQIDSPKGVTYKLSAQQAERYEIDPKYTLTPEEFNRQPVEILPAGERGLYFVENERTKRFGLWGRVCASPQKVAEALGLPGSAVVSNPLLDLDRPPRGAWIEIRGKLTGNVIATARRKIHRAVGRDQVDCIIFELACNGGPDTVDDADALAKEIQALSKQRILTIGFIPSNVRGSGTFLALACSRIIMGPNAELGDCLSLMFDDRGRPLRRSRVELHRKRLVTLAESQGYTPVLVEGLLNPDLEIVRVRAKPDPARPDEPPPTFMSRQEAEANADRWIVVETIKRPGEPFFFRAREALDWGIAWDVVENASLENVARLEGIDPRDIKRMAPDWLDSLVNLLTHPVATLFLVIVAFTCLILEFKTPGLGLPAILFTLCILLVFWSHSMDGEPNALAILLFLLGLILVGVELFLIPGFGIAGISGLVLVLLSLSLAVVQRWPQSQAEYVELGVNTGMFAAGLIVSMIAAYSLARYLPSIPYANRLMLPPPDVEESDAAAPLPPASSPALLGAIGIAVTPLRPGGKVRIGDEFIDVVAEGHFLDAGARVQVIEIDGVRVIVKPV